MENQSVSDNGSQGNDTLSGCAGDNHNNINGSSSDAQQQQPQQPLCASCDRCRSRKTKCDGKRPCSNCVFKYMKKKKIDSIESINSMEVDCMYSPAKRRGPTPGKSSQADGSTSSRLGNHGVQPQQFDDVLLNGINTMNRTQESLSSLGVVSGVNNDSNNSNNLHHDWQQQHQLQQLQQQQQQLQQLQQQQLQQLQQQQQLQQAPPPSSSSLLDNVETIQAVSSNGSIRNNNNVASSSTLTQQQQQQHQQQRLAAAALIMAGSSSDVVNSSNTSNGGTVGRMGLAPSSNELTTMQHQLHLLQHQIQQRQQLQLTQQLQQQQQHSHVQPIFTAIGTQASVEPLSQRRRVDAVEGKPVKEGLPQSILTHTHMLDRGDSDGSRLRAFYRLSIDEMFRLPSTPSDEEYCASTGKSLVGRHLAALSASRFAEAALGAIVNNEITLAMELCNAVVHCLREAIHDLVDSSIVFEVAKAYFLLAVFRSIRGDMVRYFKYRRVALYYIAQLKDNNNSYTLLAAMTLLDTWAYMIHNGNAKQIHNVDGSISAMELHLLEIPAARTSSNAIEEKYGIKTGVSQIANDPINKNWIHGAPAIYLNNEAPINARILDALSFVARTCNDVANNRFATLSKENGFDTDSDALRNDSGESPTAKAARLHDFELCSRNVVLSAFSLMQQDEANKIGFGKNEGLHVLISAMDAFLDDGYSQSDHGFTDNQIQTLLSVCNSVIENPFILHHAGPTYHAVTNSAVLLCHLLNGLYAMKKKNLFGPMELTLFEEVFDSLVAIRKVLSIHRRKLPVRLRCHDIPRIPFDRGTSVNGSNGAVNDDHPLIDLGETLLCCCRGCQGFVLMACCPFVAAERARDAANQVEVVAAQENEAIELGALTDFYGDIGSEFDIDDDTLLGVFENLVKS